MLEQEIEDLFRRSLAGTPWVIRMTTGEFSSFEDASLEELIHGLTIQARVHEEAILMLARAIDKLSQDEPS